ncbi:MULTISPECIES: ABC transporter permease [Alcaligenes]|jgi:iron(III) transport system permease protein|uniref:Iron ABC transporter permease n=1 Tax=Alcaligenes aquatilis TaxID=323284 RepID=A0A3G2HXK8_9BURK|nr:MULTISPECIES: iron ABC transporter permease [Alcaligenes]AWG36762.1 ABC transporter permease [Alcaligenes aquatilis]AYN21803.1 iron ABC transporter permease [Alcaligenes aquatilis]MCC9164172.1 iron ABC transporter permease [Alcaligenes sp. MMA]MCH4225940.1 iron ABC transporter permease [Alcaligenes faecalis]QXR35207.1 iron ABC transporter permease [Alcaligenes aquatilis]
MNQTRRPLSWSLILIVGFLTLCPVLMLLLGSFSQGLTAFGSFTTAKYVAAYTDPFLLEVTFNTVVFVLGSSLFSTALAVFLAYLNTRTNMPMKGVFTVLSIVPMMIPHLLFSVSWALLLNPSNGLINMFLQDTLGLQDAPLNIYSLWGMILVEGLLNMPVAYLIIAPAMASFDVSMEESSRVFGGGLWRTLTRVTLPILRPAIMAAFILAIVRALASYAVPRVLGTPGRVDVLATYLFEMISTGFAPDYGKAAALGMSVLSASIALIVLYRYMTKESSKYVTISSRGFKPTQLELRRAKIPLFIIVGIISLLMVVLPVAVLLYTSMIPYSMVPSARAFSLMSWANWIDVIQDPISKVAMTNSLFLAVFGASLGVLLSLFVAYVVVKLRTRAAALLDTLSFLSFSFPGIVIGIGFMWFFVQTPLYATLTALLLAYIAAYLPYGIRPLSAAFVQVHAHLEESSAVAGASSWTTMRRIIIPLLIPGVVSAWILMATMFIRELTVSVVLSRPGTEVLAVQVLSYAEDGLWGKLSALGIIMILISTVLVLLAMYIGNFYKRRQGTM